VTLDRDPNFFGAHSSPFGAKLFADTGDNLRASMRSRLAFSNKGRNASCLASKSARDAVRSSKKAATGR
jgi:hypothetical protein